MEVDRVGRMEPVTPQRTPAWTRDGLRRRRFVSEVEPEVEGDSEDSAEKQSDGDPRNRRELDVMA
jgi:hypothetical protein